MNLLKGRIVVKGGAFFVTESGATLPLPSAPPGSDRRPAVYGIRPEHLGIGGSDGLAAEVSVVEPTGSETQVFARVGGQELVAVSRERVGIEPGQSIHLVPDPGSVHLFDAETGRRLN